MCGILGMIGKPKPKAKKNLGKLFTHIFEEAESRGKDASGFAAIVKEKKESKISFSKLPLKASHFVEHDFYYRKLWSRDVRAVIAHTRFSTLGNPKVNKNNHPFSAHQGNLWGLHNGKADVLKSKVSMKSLKTNCDSEYLVRIVEKHGIETGAKMILNSFASVASMFLDRETDQVHIFRNEQRPCWIVDMRETAGVYLFCSTEEILMSAIQKLNIDIDPDVFEVEPYTLYSFDIDLNIGREDISVKSKYKVKAPDMRYKYTFETNFNSITTPRQDIYSDPFFDCEEEGDVAAKLRNGNLIGFRKTN